MEHAASGSLNQAARPVGAPKVVCLQRQPGSVALSQSWPGRPGTGPWGRVERQPAPGRDSCTQRGEETMSEVDTEMPEPTDEASDAEDDARTGEEQAAINRENDPPA